MTVTSSYCVLLWGWFKCCRFCFSWIKPGHFHGNWHLSASPVFAGVWRKNGHIFLNAVVLDYPSVVGAAGRAEGQYRKAEKQLPPLKQLLHVQLLYLGCPCGQRALGLHAERRRQLRTALPSWCASALQVWSIWSTYSLVLHPCKRAVAVICDQLCLMGEYSGFHIPLCSPTTKLLLKLCYILKLRCFIFQCNRT